MNATGSSIAWWRSERDKIRTQLMEKSKTQLLSEVETMILNPYTLEHARDQVRALNRSAGDCSDQKR